MELWKDSSVVSFEAKVSAGVTVIKSGRTVLGWLSVVPGSA